jgi:hypothetical protein
MMMMMMRMRRRLLTTTTTIIIIIIIIIISNGLVGYESDKGVEKYDLMNSARNSSFLEDGRKGSEPTFWIHRLDVNPDGHESLSLPSLLPRA